MEEKKDIELIYKTLLLHLEQTESEEIRSYLQDTLIPYIEYFREK